MDDLDADLKSWQYQPEGFGGFRQNEIRLTNVDRTWYGGGHLARDLTLPRLRREWPDSPQG